MPESASIGVQMTNENKTEANICDKQIQPQPQLRKQDFLNESESQNHIGDLMWTESQYRTLRNEIRTLLEAQAGQNP